MNTIHVTIVYALPNRQYINEIEIACDSTVKEAILSSNILNTIKKFSLYDLKIGIYNKLVCLNSKVKDGDRIEIYRELKIDPKEWRRKKCSVVKK